MRGECIHVPVFPPTYRDGAAMDGQPGVPNWNR